MTQRLAELHNKRERRVHIKEDRKDGDVVGNQMDGSVRWWKGPVGIEGGEKQMIIL